MIVITIVIAVVITMMAALTRLFQLMTATFRLTAVLAVPANCILQIDFRFANLPLALVVAIHCQQRLAGSQQQTECQQHGNDPELVPHNRLQ